MRDKFSNYVKDYEKIFKLKSTDICSITRKEVDNYQVHSSEISKYLLEKKKERKIKRVVIKAFSMEPNINGYGIIAKEKREFLKKGLESLKNILNTQDVIFIIDGKDKMLTSEISTLGNIKRVKSIFDYYDEKLLFKVYGKEINANEILIVDFMTLVYLGQEELKEPSMIYFTVYGNAVEGNRVFEVPNNTNLESIFTELNGNISTLKKVVIGGSINGISKYNLDYKVDKKVKSILFLTEKDSPVEKSVSCIRCGKCLRVCKEGLNPIKLMELNKRKEKDEFVKFRGDKCIECGLCSYICPCNLELAQSIKTAKVSIGKKTNK